MTYFLKLLPLLFKLQDVTDAVKEKYPDGKPFWTTKRFWGSVLVIVFGGLTAANINVDLDPNMLAENIAGIVTLGASAAGAAYGLAMTVKGAMDAKKRSAKP